MIFFFCNVIAALYNGDTTDDGAVHELWIRSVADLTLLRHTVGTVYYMRLSPNASFTVRTKSFEPVEGATTG